jgi:hypothetical protein
VPRALCLDTTALIHFEAAGALPILELMCTQDGSASVPVSVVGEWHGHTEDPAGHVIGHPWLKVVRADEAADLQIVADLSRRYPTPPDKNQGEMDVVAISKRLGYVALMEDGVGCKQADDHGVPHLAIVTLLACCVAYGLVVHKVAWRTHVTVEQTRGLFHSILIADRDGKRGFAAAVIALRQLKQAEGDPPLIDFISRSGHLGLDGVLLAAARATMNAAIT